MILFVDEKGQVKLNDQVVPGVIKKVSVDNSIIFEEKDKVGGSGKYKVIQGWDDADATIDIELLEDEDPNTGKVLKTCYDYLSEINEMFIKQENGLPVIYKITHPHAQARKLKRLVFYGFPSEESDGCITCSLKFKEYESFVSKVQKTKKDNPTTTGDQKKKDTLTSEQQKKITELKNKGKVNWGGYSQ
jgi:hypothetical protein